MKRLLVDLRRLFSPKTPADEIWVQGAAGGALPLLYKYYKDNYINK